MDEEVYAPGVKAPDASPPPIFAFVAVGRGLPNKCSACGSHDHILSSCTALDDALLRSLTLAKRKMIIHKYGTLVALPLLTHAY
jgi:hypothetical protein